MTLSKDDSCAQSPLTAARASSLMMLALLALLFAAPAMAQQPDAVRPEASRLQPPDPEPSTPRASPVTVALSFEGVKGETKRVALRCRFAPRGSRGLLSSRTLSP